MQYLARPSVLSNLLVLSPCFSLQTVLDKQTYDFDLLEVHYKQGRHEYLVLFFILVFLNPQ